MAGARLVTASETERGRLWAEKKIQQMTGGDPITARLMRQDEFTFIPQYKIFIIGNHMPRLTSVGDAMKRRLKLIPFLNKPIKVDPDLPQKLETEYPSILRWIIEGCLDWQKNGFVKCPAVETATEEYFAEEDLFGQWLKEECDVEPGNKYKNAAAAELFSAWKAYLTKMGQDTTPWNSTSFGLEMRKHAEKDRAKTGTRWLGIGLKRANHWNDRDY